VGNRTLNKYYGTDFSELHSVKYEAKPDEQ